MERHCKPLFCDGLSTKIHHLKRLFGIEGAENVLAAVDAVAVEVNSACAFDDESSAY